MQKHSLRPAGPEGASNKRIFVGVSKTKTSKTKTLRP